MFVDHGYVQHAGEKSRRKYCLRYHMYLILEEMPLKDAIEYASSNGLSVAPKDEAEIGGEDCTVAVARSTTDVRSEDDREVQVCVIPNED